MESPRISLARVLELGVCVSWREALSIAHEAVARAGATEGAGPARLTAESCLLTRGGDVVLTGTAAQARPEVAVRLLDDLLASCSNPGRFSGAVADGTALDIIEQWSQDTTPKRRRAEVASVAIRGLAAEADAARSMAAADEQHPSADFDDLIAAPPPAASPTDFPRPWVTALGPPPAMPTIPDPTFSLLEDADDDNAEVRRPDLDHEDLIAAVEAAPPPAASPADRLWPRVAALAPPPAIPTIDEQTFALLGDSAVGDAEVRRPDLDHEDLVAAVDATPPPAASIPEQTFALLEDSAVGDAEIPSPGLDLEDLIAAVDKDLIAAIEAASPPAASIPAQTFALLEDAAVGDAEVGPSLDLEGLIAAVDASPAPAASIPEQTFALLEDSANDDAEVRRPGLAHEDLVAAVDATPPPAASIPEQTFALLEDSAVGDAEVPGPGLDLEDLIAAIEAAPPPAASIDEQTFALLEDSAVDAEVPRPGLDLENLIAAVDAAPPPAASIPEQTFALLEDAAVDDAEVRPGLDLEDLIAAVDAAPPPAASIPEQTFALLDDAAVDDAEVRPGLDLEDLIAAVGAPPPPAASIPEQTFAQLEDSAVDAEVPRPGLDLENLIAAVDAAPPPAASIPEQTFALLEDAAVGDAEVRPNLDHEDLIAAVDAAPTPAPAPTDVLWPWVTALAPLSPIPTVHDQTFALLGDSAVSDAEVDRPGLEEGALVALRGLAAEADAARAMADAEEQHRSADVDDEIAAPTPAAAPADLPRPWVTALAPPAAMPTIPDPAFALLDDSAVGDAAVRGPGLDLKDLIAAFEAAREWTTPEDAVAPLAIGTSPAQGPRPSVTLRPASFPMDLPSAKPLVNAVWTYVWGGYASSCDRVRRSSPVALVCSVLALASGGILGLQLPETRWSAVEPSAPAIEPPESGAPVGLDGQTPHARPDPALMRETAGRPSVPPLIVRSAPRDSPRIEGRRARFTEVPDSYVWSMPRPARRPEAPAKDTATVARSRSLSTTSAAAALLAPGAANSAGAPPPAVDPSSVVASPSATASSPAETFVSASNNMPVNAVARSPDRELETRAIENVLGRYRIAFNRLDAGAALAVWPTVNEKTLANAFERLESHDMSFRSCQIEIISVIAEAACSGSARYVPKVGSRTPKTEERRWRFMLRKARAGWLIETVDAR